MEGLALNQNLNHLVSNSERSSKTYKSISY